MSAAPCNYKMIGRTLRALRQSRGWTQAELAAKANRNLSTITALERGQRNMSISTLLALCRTLNCKPSELLGK